MSLELSQENKPAQCPLLIMASEMHVALWISQTITVPQPVALINAFVKKGSNDQKLLYVYRLKYSKAVSGLGFGLGWDWKSLNAPLQRALAVLMKFV